MFIFFFVEIYHWIAIDDCNFKNLHDKQIPKQTIILKHLKDVGFL
jgi:hypothetical protein